MLSIALLAGFQYSLFAQKKKSNTDTSIYLVAPVAFNSVFADFSPVYYKNGVVFTSSRINAIGVKYTSETGAPLTDLYYTEEKPHGGWKAVKSLGSSINTKFNDGPCAFNSSDTEMYFNRNYEQKEFQSKLKIVKAKLVDEEWRILYDLPFNNNFYNYAHPSLSPSGNEIYFSSDMPGGYGGMDLYVSQLKDTVWTEPVNLGSIINTERNEVFPFISIDEKLYFSSNGHEGTGGLDIFYTEKREEKWKEPENMGKPFNSERDDFGIAKDSTGKKGFFSSNREDPDNDQIYSFRLNQPVFSNCPFLKENNYCVTLFEETTLLNDTLPFRYEWEIQGMKIKGRRIKHCFNGPGDYEVKLSIIDSVVNNTLHEQVSYIVEIRDEEQVFIDAKDSTYIGQETKFSGLKSNLSECLGDKYAWDFGDGQYKNGALVTHVYKEPGTYIVRLGVSDSSKSSSEKNAKCDNCVLKTITVLGRGQ